MLLNGKDRYTKREPNKKDSGEGGLLFQLGTLGSEASTAPPHPGRCPLTAVAPHVPSPCQCSRRQACRLNSTAVVALDATGIGSCGTSTARGRVAASPCSKWASRRLFITAEFCSAAPPRTLPTALSAPANAAAAAAAKLAASSLQLLGLLEMHFLCAAAAAAAAAASSAASIEIWERRVGMRRLQRRPTPNAAPLAAAAPRTLGVSARQCSSRSRRQTCRLIPTAAGAV
jgi:hypothetical protein